MSLTFKHMLACYFLQLWCTMFHSFWKDAAPFLFSIVSQLKRRTTRNRECSIEQHKKEGETRTTQGELWKIFASVNDLYRTKRMYQKTYNDEDRNESAGSIRMYDINDIEEGWDLFTKTYTDNNLQSEMILQKSCSNRIQST